MQRTLSEIKLLIWTHRKINRNPVDLQSYADKAGVRLPITQEHEAEKLLKLLNKGTKKTISAPVESLRRYREAKIKHQTKNFPNWMKDGHFIEPDRPTEDTNGLQTFIINFLDWNGHFANRTSNEGRVIINKNKEAKRIKSSSKNGMQDIDSNLKHSQHKFGIPWKIEVKAMKDVHKTHQEDFGKIVQQTGGVYSVVKNSTDFLKQYDELMIGNIEQSCIFD